MGEAKRRGTREQRMAQSIERQRVQNERRRQEARDWWESLTPEEKNIERQKRRKARMATNTLLAIAGSLEPEFLDSLMED